MGWLGAIIVGGLAGWLAEKFMKSDMGVFMNIILGIIGAIVLNAILAAFDVVGYESTWSWAYLIVGFIGACLLIAVFRMFRGRSVR
ncbi:GlsB/YeaQ/YmgE family stress response membrane protein [Consotaella salsifontis]|uniref:Uncharacterized membrane protein YeaQ/YmgE, transglycosylase-associated protein family n=1 Tax=Consotaella salsifontis TaxID=1365950 RepID=A0A1T4T026_9HYPH|nr:GlsB/YeaQ/YmgE family stress response membrane protein [Consotaella salsifontis]SKA33826.1 Uncharacterized membrane protein YeaQ/YmgE, transglycosylase-associated protein family [Consotaella salsifontis]